jgi:beta-lactamase regulating signal transducer with metallopeptidase domain
MVWLSSFLLGLIAPVLQAALLVILVRRGLRRRFPFFFAYTLYSLVVIVVRLWVMDRPRMFFVVYWITEMVVTHYATGVQCDLVKL